MNYSSGRDHWSGERVLQKNVLWTAIDGCVGDLFNRFGVSMSLPEVALFTFALEMVLFTCLFIRKYTLSLIFKQCGFATPLAVPNEFIINLV